MKKVLHYKNGPYLPLTENWIYEIIKNQHKYLNLIYCHGILNEKLFPVDKIKSLALDNWKKDPIVFLNIIWNKLFHFYPFFYSSILKDKPNLIHAHFGPSGYEILKLKKMMNIPLITTFYGQDLSMLPKTYPKWKERYKKLFNEGDCFLVEGSHMKKNLIDSGCPENKVILQHIGIDLSKIKFEQRNYDKKEGIKILISAGFREKKGIPYALEAIGIARKRLPMLQIEITIIGDSSGDLEGEKEKRKILDVIDKYQLGRITKMLGFKSHEIFIANLYKHHIFISPSITSKNGDDEGGSPVSITEASASGMPVISTLHCDISEVIINNKTGYLSKEKDTKQLTDNLLKMISNPISWEEMGKAARKHIEKNYNIKKQVVKLERIYEDLIEQKTTT